jgi:hypothetical protein
MSARGSIAKIGPLDTLRTPAGWRFGVCREWFSVAGGLTVVGWQQPTPAAGIDSDGFVICRNLALLRFAPPRPPSGD